jgi:hypothetical protein
VVIFEARPPSAGSAVEQLAPACKTGATSTSRRCNVYTNPYEAFLAVQEADVDYFRCSGGAGIACGYDPLDRDDGPIVANIDYIGVYIAIDRPLLSKLFGDSVTLELGATARLEPGTTG